MLIGTMARNSCEWRVPATPDAALTDPTTVGLQIRLPDASTVSSTYGGASAAGTIVKDATGQYHADYLPATAGSYWVRWTGTGTAYAAFEYGFAVEASAL